MFEFIAGADVVTVTDFSLLHDVSATLTISDIVDTAVASCSTTQHQPPDIRNNNYDAQQDTSISDTDSSSDDPDYIPSNSSLVVQSSPVRNQQQIPELEINQQPLEVEVIQQPQEVEVNQQPIEVEVNQQGPEPPDEQPVVRNRVRIKIADKTKWKRITEKEKRMKGQAYFGFRNTAEGKTYHDTEREKKEEWDFRVLQDFANCPKLGFATT